MHPEIAQYLDSIERQRGKVWEILQSAPLEAWNWTPTQDETNSLFVLATHCIGSEHGWLFEILGRGKKTRNRPAEFVARGAELDELKARYVEVGQETGAVLMERTDADLMTTRTREGFGQVSERWILLHVIEHYSEHLGQMDLTRQLWEQQGEGKAYYA